MHVITELNLGVETIIVGVTSAPKPDQSNTAIKSPYLVGLKNPLFTYKYLNPLLRKELLPLIVNEPQIIKRRGWNAVCAMFPERDSHIILWGISSEEFIARQYASTRKVSLYIAKAIINRAGHRGTISVHSPTADGAASSNIPIPISKEIYNKPKDKENPSREIIYYPKEKDIIYLPMDMDEQHSSTTNSSSNIQNDIDKEQDDIDKEQAL
jgi:hypothetical protein